MSNELAAKLRVDFPGVIAESAMNKGSSSKLMALLEL